MDFEDIIRPGLRVRTKELEPPVGFLISEQALRNRRAGFTGTVYGYVAGHGGDVWWVVHDGARTVVGENGGECWSPEDVAPYGLGELEVAPEGGDG